MFELVEKPVTEEKKPAARRVYVVSDAKGDKHLVKASSPGQAVAHTYKPFVKVASQDDLITLRTVDVEDAA
jgi:hypothetical protein